ncbi:hypothetical protein ACFQ0I_15140 [Mariniflexile aquimaris]|uniref:Uncharacterized protein n=1 Tax=Mariniflexile aquimaris TaxID=881009 RepID=A0ABW3BYC0_9FLAO
MELHDIKNLVIDNIDNHPELKRRLEIYISMTYEENAIFDDKYLLKEFNYLKENNMLNELFKPIHLNE